VARPEPLIWFETAPGRQTLAPESVNAPTRDRTKLLLLLSAVTLFRTMTGTSFADECSFKGAYSFHFYGGSAFPFTPNGVGFFTVISNSDDCSSAIVSPGGIIYCNNVSGQEWLSTIEAGSVSLDEASGLGAMPIKTSGDGVCGTSDGAIELDISVVQGGKMVLFNSDGEKLVASATIRNAGHDILPITGEADKCFAGQVAGCYDFRFWGTFLPGDGDCTICLNGSNLVSAGTCTCNFEDTEYLSEIESGGYSLADNCQSGPGYLWFTTSGDKICGQQRSLALDFAVAQQGNEIMGACDTARYILDNKSVANTGFLFNCAFDGYLQ